MYREICQTLAPNIDPNLFMPISNEDSKDFLSLIIHGSNESDYDTNKIIFNIIHKFITNTKRFIWYLHNFKSVFSIKLCPLSRESAIAIIERRHSTISTVETPSGFVPWVIHSKHIMFKYKK